MIYVIGGPWPERIGAVGNIVESACGHYPFVGLGPNEVVVVLHADPLCATKPMRDEPLWTCVLDRENVTER